MHSSSKFLTFCFLVFTLAFVSCKDDNKQKEGSQQEQVDDSSAQMKEVMAIHDEVMPKMSDIAKLSGALKPLITEDSLAQKKFDDLVRAHEEMMNWMQEFGTKFNSDEIMNGAALSKEKQDLLIQEKIAIDQVKETMLSAISDAENYLKEKD